MYKKTHRIILKTEGRKDPASKPGFVLLLVTLCVLFSAAHAEKMGAAIQEALYLFEMKGEFAKATKILEKAVSEGDAQDKEQASFYLGKIQELSGNKQSAYLYYKQSLSSTNETAKAYWLAERLAETADKAETIQKKRLHTNSPIKKIFYGNPNFIYLENGSVFKIKEDSLVRVPTGISNSSEILEITATGIWYYGPEKDSLRYKPLNSAKQSKSFALRNPKDLVTAGNKAIIQGDYALVLVNKKGEEIQSSDKYNGCSLELFHTATNHAVLNCPDNALHFLSSEDLSESFVLSQFDAIQHVTSVKDDLLFYSGGNLFCYNPQKSREARWKIPFNSVESITPFEQNVAILEASGKVTLINRMSGTTIAMTRSDADRIHPLAKGTLGLFTSEGALITVDTLLRPLWNFNFARPISMDPIFTDGNIYLNFDTHNLQGINSKYYGKTPLASNMLSQQAAVLAESSQWEKLDVILDTLLKLEPGNAEAWLFKALRLENTNGKEQERQKAWSEAVRLSVSNPQVTPLILGRYGKAIGAKFVSLLNISPKTRYPQFFGSKKNIYTVDPAASRLLCINAENGEVRWSRGLSKMDNSPVISSDEKSLALSSGFSLNLYDLNKDGTKITVQLPGKAFNIAMESDALYVSTWNGFLLKISRSDGRLAWSRKVFSVPFLFTKDGTQIIAASLEGNITHLWEGSGQIKSDAPKIPSNISQMARIDSTIVFATSNNRLYLLDSRHSEKEPLQILMESPIASLQTFRFQEKNCILVGLANQSLYLYTVEGTPLWKFQGSNSIFSSAFVDDGLAWLDQGSEVIALDLSDGKVVRRFSTPGGAGSPFILNKTLYSASSKRLLYGFSL